MNDLQTRSPLGGLSNTNSGGLGLSRRSSAGRGVSQVQAQGLVRAAAVDVESSLDQMKLASAVSLARSAQTEVAMLTGMEAELIKAVPLAANRLEFISNLACIQIGELLADGMTRLRRM